MSCLPIFIGDRLKSITLIIDSDVLGRYYQHYFSIHRRAKKLPIPHPYHESINVWMIMKRPMMNQLKQRWKDFIVWFVNDQGYTNLRIDKCELIFTAYYSNTRRHDPDNSVPKFILDGLVDGGMIIDDDSSHVLSLTLKCSTDQEHPRTEIHFNIFE